MHLMGSYTAFGTLRPLCTPPSFAARDMRVSTRCDWCVAGSGVFRFWIPSRRLASQCTVELAMYLCRSAARLQLGLGSTSFTPSDVSHGTMCLYLSCAVYLQVCLTRHDVKISYTSAETRGALLQGVWVSWPPFGPSSLPLLV